MIKVLTCIYISSTILESLLYFTYSGKCEADAHVQTKKQNQIRYISTNYVYICILNWPIQCKIGHKFHATYLEL